MDTKSIDFHEIWFTKSQKSFQNFYFGLSQAISVLSKLHTYKVSR